MATKNITGYKKMLAQGQRIYLSLICFGSFDDLNLIKPKMLERLRQKRILKELRNEK